MDPQIYIPTPIGSLDELRQYYADAELDALQQAQLRQEQIRQNALRRMQEERAAQEEQLRAWYAANVAPGAPATPEAFTVTPYTTPVPASTQTPAGMSPQDVAQENARLLKRYPPPVQQPTLTEPTPIPSVWDNINQTTQFARVYLPRRGKTIKDFIESTYDERARIANEYVQARAVQDKLTPEQTAQLAKQMEAIVWADNGGRPHRLIDSIVNNDLLDKAWAGLRGLGTTLVAGGLSAAQLDSAAQAVRDWNAAGQRADVEDFSAKTREADMLYARQQKINEAKGGTALEQFGRGAANALSYALSNPAAALGTAIGSAGPALATAAVSAPGAIALGGATMLTQAREAARAQVMNADLSSLPGFAQLVKQVGDAQKAKQLVADSVIDDTSALGVQALAGLIGAVGGRFGIESAVRKTGVNNVLKNAYLSGIQRALAKTANSPLQRAAARVATKAPGVLGSAVAEGTEGAVENSATQIAANVASNAVGNIIPGAPQVSLTQGVAGQAGEGAVQEALAGGALRPVADYLRNTASPVPIVQTTEAQAAGTQNTTTEYPVVAPRGGNTFSNPITLIEQLDNDGLTQEEIVARDNALYDVFALSNKPELSIEEIQEQVPTLVFRSTQAPNADATVTVADVDAEAEAATQGVNPLDVSESTPEGDTPAQPDTSIEALNVVRPLQPGVLPLDPVITDVLTSSTPVTVSQVVQQAQGVPARTDVGKVMLGAGELLADISAAVGKPITVSMTDEAQAAVKLDQVYERNLESVVRRGLERGLIDLVQAPAVVLRDAPNIQHVRASLQSLFDAYVASPLQSKTQIRSLAQFVSRLTSDGAFQEQMRAVDFNGRRNKKESVFMAYADVVADATGHPASAKAVSKILGSALKETQVLPTKTEVSAAAVPEVQSPGSTESTVTETEQDTKHVTEKKPRIRDTFMTARYASDPKDVQRGSAYLADPDTDLWYARFIRDDGTRIEAAVTGFTEAKRFLARFGTQVDGKMQYAVVTTAAKNSGHKANYSKIITRLDSLTPKMRIVYGALTRIGVTPDRAYDVAIGLSKLSGGALSRLGGLDVFRGAADIKREALYLRSLGRASIKSSGLSTDPSFRDVADKFYDGLEDLIRRGVPAEKIYDYFYALSAMQRNTLRAKTYMYDTEERHKSKDFSAFSYVDAEGNTISGLDAPRKFIEEFNRNYGGRFTEQLEFLKTYLRDMNKYLLAIELANGVIGPAQHAQYMEEDLYLPMREPTAGRATPRAPQTVGRRTKAQHPVLQWRAVAESRILYAQDVKILQEILRLSQRMPNMNLVRINAQDLKLKAQRADVDFDEEGNILTPFERRKRAWNNNTVSVWDGDQQYTMEIVDPVLAKALRPDRESFASHTTLHLAGLGTRAYAMMLVSPPAFWLMTATWDLISVPITTQGAFNLTDKAAKQQVLRTYKNILTALGGAAKRVVQEAVGAKITTSDPVRQLYNRYGGGIRLGTATDTQDALEPKYNLKGMRKVVSGVSDAVGAAFNLVNVPGHIMSEAIRYAAFKARLQESVGEETLKNPMLLSALAHKNPELIKSAVMGSKNVLNNYEDTGRWLLGRALLPFWNASTAGFIYTQAYAYGTRSGRRALGIVASVAFLAALANLSNEEEDKDADGFSKYMRKQSSWTGIDMGDFVLPLPPDMRGILAMANLAAANVTGRDIDHTDAFRKTLVAFIGGLPIIPGATSTIEDRPLSSEFGPLGVLTSVILSDTDTLGRAWVSPAAARQKTRPFYENPRPSDTILGVETSKYLFDAFAWDIPPAKIDAVVNMFTGGWGGLLRERALGLVDGRGAEQATFDWLFKGYRESVPSEFASLNRWRQEAAEVKTDPIRAAQYAQKEKDIEKITKGLGTLSTTRAEALRRGDATTWQQTDALIKDKVRRADITRKEYYQYTGNQQRDLLN